MQFSRRTGWESGENAWAEAVRSARALQPGLMDLTVANPSACGLAPDAVNVLSALSDKGALRYSPDPLGMHSAREAVATYYGDHGAQLSPEHICLTTSTSEAYSYLFRLLCDPGDEVLVAWPSYPLFDLLARLDDVALREYPLLYDPGAARGGEGGWSIDLDALQAFINPRTRAVLAVHPNNPTGNFVSREERVALRALCAERDLALIVDEVFLDYALEPQWAPASDTSASFAGEESECLCFVLSGLSKICALPQMKLSWIVSLGPEPLLRAAIERLEIVADTFLSVNAPVQYALPIWLAQRNGVQAAIRERLRHNLQQLDQTLGGTSCSRLNLQGGWTVVLRVPRHVEGTSFAAAALTRGVLLQPGELYGFSEGRCVASLLTPPDVWERGLERLPL